MEIKKIKKNQKIDLPCFIVGGKDGWVLTQAPCDGILVRLNTLEKQTGGAFIPNEILENNGYKTGKKIVNLNPLINGLVKRYTKLALLSLLRSVDEKTFDNIPSRATKNDIAKLYLESLMK